MRSVLVSTADRQLPVFVRLHCRAEELLHKAEGAGKKKIEESSDTVGINKSCVQWPIRAADDADENLVNIRQDELAVVNIRWANEWCIIARE